MKLSKEESHTLDIIKSFSIFSVICAHIAPVDKENIYLEYFSLLMTSLGSIGVICFFLISGFFFSSNKDKFKNLFSKKLRRIGIPWLVCGSLVYLYVALRKEGPDLSSYLNFLIGNGSYLYYLTILFLCYFLFYYFRKNTFFLILVITGSIFSLLLTITGMLPEVNPYLNPFNWFVYFAVGILLMNYNKLGMLIKVANKLLWPITIVFIIIIIKNIIENQSINYWTSSIFIFIPISILFLFGLASQKKVLSSAFLQQVGKDSFSIYLLHMPVAGLVVYITNKYQIDFFILIRPLIVLVITFSFISLYRKIFSRNDFRKHFHQLIGIS